MGLPSAYNTSDNFYELLSHPDIAPMFYVMVSGIPYVFSNQPLPDAWSAGGGTISIDSETYTWHQSLIVTDDFGGVSQRAEPKRGLGIAGSMSLNFLVTGDDGADGDLWLSLLSRDLGRTDKAATNLSAELTVDTVGGSEVITVDDASDFATSNQAVYIGTETIVAGDGSNTSTTIHGITTRGAYKSWPQTHKVSGDPRAESQFAGPFVTTWPVAWEGRVVRLYMALGVWDSAGNWKPYKNTSSTARKVQEVYKGVITGIREGDDTLSVTIETSSVDQLLGNKVASYLPVGRVAQWARWPMAGGSIYVGPHNWYLSYEYVAIEQTAVDQHKLVLDARLYDGTDDVAEGMYTYMQVCEFIAATIVQNGPPNSAVSMEVRAFQRSITGGQGKDTRHEICLSFVMPSIEDYDLFLFLRGGQYTSIIRDLGFTADAAMKEVERSSNKLAVVATSNEPAPVFRWPGRNDPAPNRIYPQSSIIETLAVTVPGYVDDDGNAIPAALLISGANEIVEVGAIATESVASGQVYSYYPVTRRGIYGTGKNEDHVQKYDPDSDKVTTLTQGIYLPNTSLERALFYLWGGGSGVNGTLDADWDQGWDGTGLALPMNLLDEAGIQSVANDITPRRNQIWIDKPTPLRDWLAPELLIEQVIMIARSNFETGSDYAMAWVQTHPPSEATVANERVLDHTNTRTFGGGNVGLDRQENKIINAINVKCAYDHGTRKFETEINQNHVTSQQVWGERDDLDLSVRTIGGAADSIDLATQLAQRVFDRYALPYEIVELDACSAQTWGWQIGDIVSITNTALPSLDGIGRGWEGVKFRLMIKKDNLQGGGGMSSRLTLVRGGGMNYRYTMWAPSALMTTNVSGNEWNFEAHEYSSATDPVDVSWFAAGYKVRLHRFGGTTSTAYTILSVDEANNRVTFTGSIDAAFTGGGGDVVMTFDDYGTSGIDAEQRKFAYMSAFDNSLSGDRPFRYS